MLGSAAASAGVVREGHVSVDVQPQTHPSIDKMVYNNDHKYSVGSVILDTLGSNGKLGVCMEQASSVMQSSRYCG